MNNLKLDSIRLETIASRLEALSKENHEISSEAYKSLAHMSRCGCKSTCDGGCTSW